jgi:IS30 family transposase
MIAIMSSYTEAAGSVSEASRFSRRFSAAEISKLLNIRPGTVRIQMKRGREILKGKIEKFEAFEN